MSEAEFFGMQIKNLKVPADFANAKGGLGLNHA